MKITGIFPLITISVVLFSSLTTIEADPVVRRCSKNKDCTRSLACYEGICTNVCESLQEEGRTCRMKHHKPTFKCKHGYEFPENGDRDLCLPVEWKCYVDESDPDDIVKCQSPLWSCKKSDEGVVTCQVLKTLEGN